MQSASKRDAVKYSNLKFMMHNVDFFLADSPWIRSLPFSKFKIMEICQRVSCFVDLEKAYDHVSRDKLWAVMLEYDVRDQLLAAIKSLYKQSKVCVRVNSIKKILESVPDHDMVVFFLLFCS